MLLAANKTDAAKFDVQAAEFYSLGFDEPLLLSVHQNRGREDLLAAIAAKLPEPADDEADEEPVMKLAIVGRRNVGKSTFVNTLAKEERMIVSEVPGTTRDSVDVHFTLDGKRFIAIDTPGLKRKKSIADDLEFYSFRRAERSIRQADVVLLFLDAALEISRVERKLLDFIEEHWKPCIFVVNKWDLLADKAQTSDWVQYLQDEFRTTHYMPIAFITGQTGKNAKRLINHAQALFKQARQRVGTGELNRVVQAALDQNPPPLVRHRRPKVFYATQAEIQPPTIVFFCTEHQAFTPPYRRYLLNFFRDNLPFDEIPIRLRFRSRSASEASKGFQPEEAFDD